MAEKLNEDPVLDVHEEDVEDEEEERQDDDDIIAQLSNSSDQTKQLMALSNLNEILAIANDDLPFSIEGIVRAILVILEDPGAGFLAQDLMLLGYRYGLFCLWLDV
jgi:hypothetical protein